MLKIGSVSVSDATRFVGRAPDGLVAADVRFALEDDETGPRPFIDVSVDRPDAGSLTFGALEDAAITRALETPAKASRLDSGAFIEAFRRKFSDRPED